MKKIPGLVQTSRGKKKKTSTAPAFTYGFVDHLKPIIYYLLSL